jgi:hypothetical protein
MRQDWGSERGPSETREVEHLLPWRVSLRLFGLRRSRKPKYRLKSTWVGSSGSEARMMEQNLGSRGAPQHRLDTDRSG